MSIVACPAAIIAAASIIPGNHWSTLGFFVLIAERMVLKLSDFSISFILSLIVFSFIDLSFSLVRYFSKMDLSLEIFSFIFEDNLLFAIFSFRRVRTGLFCLIFCKNFVPSTGDASTACDKNNAATAMQVIIMILFFTCILTPLIFIF